MKPTVMLIDFSNLFWTQVHVNGDSFSSIRARVRESVDRAAGTIPGSVSVVCLDVGRSFRKDLSDDYKSTRPEKDAAVLAEMDRTKEALRSAGYTLAGAEGFEADDVIATLATQAAAAGHPFCIASADKDLLQLLALPESSALRTHRWEIAKAADVVTRFGVEPEGLGDWLALVGDKSDNIAGCPGVGDKRATELLTKHGGLDLLFHKLDGLHVGTGTGGVPYIESMTPAAKEIATPKIVEALWANRRQIEKARELVTLRTDAPVKLEDVLKPKEETVTTTNVDDLITPGPGAQPAREMKHDKTPAPEAPPVIETRALAVAGVTYERALEPMSTGSAVTLASKLFNSRLFTHYGTEEAVLATVLAGREYGLGAIASLRAFHNVEGKLAMHWQLIVALAERSPDCEYIMPVGQATAEKATWRAKNRKHPESVEFTYTIEDARLAGLLEVKPGKQPGPWLKRPKDQLSKTAASKLARLVFPGTALNMYCAAELGGDDEREDA